MCGGGWSKNCVRLASKASTGGAFREMLELGSKAAEQGGASDSHLNIVVHNSKGTGCELAAYTRLSSGGLRQAIRYAWAVSRTERSTSIRGHPKFPSCAADG